MAPRSNPPVPPFRRKFIARLTTIPMLLLVLLSLFSAIAGPVDAQESEQAPETDPPGTGEVEQPTPAPEAEQPPPAAVTDEPTPEPAPAPVPAPVDASTPGPEADVPEVGTEGQPETPLDPMSQEEPGEEAPATDVTVPPKDTYEGQEPYEPPEILWSSMAAADRKLGDARSAKRDAISEVRRLRKRLKELNDGQRELDTETVAALSALTAATTRLQDRAVVGYQRFGSGSDPAPEITISDYQDVVKIQRRSKLVDSALVVSEADIEELGELRASLNTEAVALLDRARIVSDHLGDAVDAVDELDGEAEQAAIEYEAFKAGSEIFIHGVVFPIAGEYEAPFDSYGFPRMPGTPDEHWHEGIDLFAPRGTPLVATERGVITKLGSGRLGGLKFWLKGESGSEWYYAHLDAFAPGMADGLVVEVGQLVGYVGNTGNAVGTPPHLHMQLHPDGGEPVNPFPLLKVVSDMERAAIAAGTHPGYEHQNQLLAGPVQIAQPEPSVDTTTVPAAGSGETDAPSEPSTPETSPPTEPGTVTGAVTPPEPEADTVVPPPVDAAAAADADLATPPPTQPLIGPIEPTADPGSNPSAVAPTASPPTTAGLASAIELPEPVADSSQTEAPAG